MTIRLARDLNGQHVAYVHDDKRLRHITDPAPTAADARAAAQRWIAAAGKVLNGGGRGVTSENALAEVTQPNQGATL